MEIDLSFFLLFKSKILAMNSSIRSLSQFWIYNFNDQSVETDDDYCHSISTQNMKLKNLIDIKKSYLRLKCFNNKEISILKSFEKFSKKWLKSNILNGTKEKLE
jgi:hypothetical protein